jgi:small-conductance mechanosensitive channel
MRFVRLLFLIVVMFGYIEANVDTKSAEEQLQLKQKSIATIQSKINNINEELNGNIWITRYENYLTYRKIEKELKKIKKDAKKYARWRGEKYKELSYQLYNKVKIKENELELISEYKNSPIGKQITPIAITKAPDISNPFIIIEAFSYIQKLQENNALYKDVNLQINDLVDILTIKLTYLEDLDKVEPTKKLTQQIKKLKQELKDFNMVLEIVATTGEVYSKKIEQIIQETNDNISAEIRNVFNLLIAIFILFIFMFIAKIAMKKYIQDDDRHYTTNKLINFFFIILSIVIILFAYIDNASYLVTFLGFASAGIAIALKDWFMSIFGWMAIMTSGSISVGDRIKVTRDGTEVVGDVLDISLFKIAIREDVTFTSYTKNRRSGRVFFIPNNYIFTDMIANYTYDGLRTVWDGIDIYITFDSNHKKAVELAKNIASSYARGYTDLTKKRLQKMRKKYVLRSTNPEPRVFSMVEPYGIAISTWYYTNSHATLALRSTVSMEILEAFKAEDDITIAYPTQTLRVSNHQVEAENLLPGTTSTGLFDAPVQS